MKIRLDDPLLTPQQRYCLKYPDRVRASKRRYAEANVRKKVAYEAKRRQEKPDVVKAIKKRWRDNNRDACRLQKRAWSANKRAREAGAEGRLKACDVISRKATCWYCGIVGNCVMDHLVPLSRGGENSPENIVPACWACNSSKGNKLLSEWKGRPCQKSA